MNPILLIDFGSTYTKVSAVDTDSETILGTAQSYTTIETDINDGLDNAMKLLKDKIGDVKFVHQYACSSAAGGLRMVAIGLVPELTAQAAKLAALGAGAKVIKTFAYELTEEDLKEIDEINPDICLLSGGTDGGNKENIVYNAKMLAKSQRNFPILIAGNRSCASQCSEILKDKQTQICENVMPRLDIQNVGPVQEQIRSLFLKQIVKAKGLSKAESLIEGILMPTPSAVLQAMQLLAQGTKDEEGFGDLVAVDLGGATTDVYSMAFGLPTTGMTSIKGLREDYSKRTVEGDIGMRYSIQGIVDANSIEEVAQLSGLSVERCKELIKDLSVHTGKVPKDAETVALDYALASLAISTAVTRHSGRLQEYYTPIGVSYLQTGKDLTGVKKLIVTGGAIIHTEKTKEIASHAFYSAKDPMSLKPKEAEILVDRSYILAAMGLLSTDYPDIALRIMKRELK